MHRKSAYILFLAVLGMLALGIVMLFSTSAFAQRQPWRRLFRQTSGLWLCVGLSSASRQRLSIIISGNAPGGSGSVSRSRARALFRSPPRNEYQWLASLGGFGQFAFQPSDFAKIAAVFFLAFWYSRYEKATGIPFKGFIVPIAHRRFFDGA